MARSDLTLAYDNSAKGTQEADATNENTIEKIGKTKHEVNLTLANGWAMRGFFYLAEGERVTDLLNGDRDFLPFLDASGMLRVLAKSQIIEIRPVG